MLCYNESASLQWKYTLRLNFYLTNLTIIAGLHGVTSGAAAPRYQAADLARGKKMKRRGDYHYLGGFDPHSPAVCYSPGTMVSGVPVTTGRSTTDERVVTMSP